MATPTRIAPGLSQSDYTGHGGSLLDWTPPDTRWMAPPRSTAIPEWLTALINPSYRLISDKSGLPSANVNPGGAPITGSGTNLDLPDADHSWAYPIYHWGNAPGETINRYLAGDVEPDDSMWTRVYWPTFTTNPNLYPHFSALADPYDLREDDEGDMLHRILVGRTQIPTEDVGEGDWFNLRSFQL